MDGADNNPNIPAQDAALIRLLRQRTLRRYQEATDKVEDGPDPLCQQAAARLEKLAATPHQNYSAALDSACVLEAMAINYADGHSWDHLDGEAVAAAATHLRTLVNLKGHQEYLHLQEKLAKSDAMLGTATRELEHLRDSQIRRNSWLASAKEDAGFDTNISFDRVWELALAAFKAQPPTPTAEEQVEVEP